MMMPRRDTPKIVHLTSGHPPFDTRVFQKECRSLCRAGYEVVLVVPHTGDQLAEGVRIKAAPLPHSRFDRFTTAARRIYREGLRQEGNAYHFHDPELIPAGLMLRLRGKCVIYDVHDDTPATFADKDYIPRLLRPPLTWCARVLENAAARRFSAVIAATPAIAERFASNNHRTIVVHNFALVENGMFSDQDVSWDERAASVAFVGGMSKQRGVAEVVRALSMLPASLAVRLEFAGWFLPPALREQVVGSPGWDRVDELGMLDHMGVASLLKRVRAGLITFHPGPNHDRAKPNKMFEYMSASIPVIASDFPLWRAIVDEAGCGLLVDPRKPEQIASAIEYVITHPREAEEMGKRGRAAVQQHYNWTVEESKLLALYASLVGTPEDRQPEAVAPGFPSRATQSREK